MFAPLHDTTGPEFLQCLRSILLPNHSHLSGEVEKDGMTAGGGVRPGTQQGVPAADWMRTWGPCLSRKQQDVEEELPVEPNTGSSAVVGGNNSERNEAGTSHFLMDSLGTSSGFNRIRPSFFQNDHNSCFQHLPLFPYMALELPPPP